MTEFQNLLREALALKGGSQADLADELETASSRISELLKKQVKGQIRQPDRDYALDTAACLRLARFIRSVDPTGVLRATGSKRQIDIADLLDQLYGVAGKERLTVFERTLHAKLKKLKPTDLAHLVAVIDLMVAGSGDVTDQPHDGVTDAKRKGR